MKFETTLTRERADQHRASGAWSDRLLVDAITTSLRATPGRRQ
jgi:hypothetical protein